MTMSLLNEENIDVNQPRYPCPCCKTDCTDEKCIICSFCSNWFHQQCAKLSDKRFNVLGNNQNLHFKCKFCKLRSKKCATCKNSVDDTPKKLYCVSC